MTILQLLDKHWSSIEGAGPLVFFLLLILIFAWSEKR